MSYNQSEISRLDFAVSPDQEIFSKNFTIAIRLLVVGSATIPTYAG